MKSYLLPKVSVIIPCFNQGKYLYEAVSSALMAYKGPLEILVVDDGSQDPQTPYYLNQVAALSKQVQVIRQINQGLSGARNTGIAKATGDFIQLLDADDLLVPCKLDAQVAHLVVAANIDVSVCNYLICDETCSNFYKPDEAIAKFDLTLKDFLYKWERGFSIPIHCALFRTSVLKQINFNHEVQAKEDWLFWCSLVIQAKKLAYLQGHYAIYRQHGNSMRRSVVNMGKNWLKALLYIDSMVHKIEPLFFESAVDWFEQYYRRHPDYHKELSENPVVAGFPPACAPLDTMMSGRILERLKFLAEPIKSPAITVIIPIYNHYNYLEECISSLAVQGTTDFDVICIDDASSDNRVKQLLQSLNGKLKRLKIIENEYNCGISATQNAAVELAKGEFVAFLDCDDALPPNALSRVQAELDRSPEADYLFTDRLDVDKFGNVLRLAKYGGYDTIKFRGSEYICNDLLDGMVASHLKIIRRSIYLAVGGCDDAVSGVQDWELALKIAEIGTLVYIPEPLYRHRIHTNSVTNSARVEQFRKTNIVRRRFQKRLLVAIENLLTEKDRALHIFKVGEDLPSLEDLKACWSQGQSCIFDLRGSQSLSVINFVREYNSYIDHILWDDPTIPVSLIGYLWGDILREPDEHRYYS